MRKFSGYPVVINYNLHTQLRANSKMDDMHRAGQYQQVKEMYIKTTRSSDSSIENNLYKEEIEKFESEVEACLRVVAGNPVGRMVLGLLNPANTVWIVPKSDDDLKRCFCAQTNPLDYQIQPGGNVGRGVGSGDTVITFRKELGDDTLLHELVHAYRYSRKKFKVLPLKPGQSSEEFFAHQMENIYLSHAKRPMTMDYYDHSIGTKDEIYNFLLGEDERMQALKYFMRHEYLAMLAAGSFTADYNPFRDFKKLEADYLQIMNMLGGPKMTELKELGN